MDFTKIFTQERLKLLLEETANHVELDKISSSNEMLAYALSEALVAGFKEASKIDTIQFVKAFELLGQNWQAITETQCRALVHIARDHGAKFVDGTEFENEVMPLCPRLTSLVVRTDVFRFLARKTANLGV